MKITKNTLRKLIKEELDDINEGIGPEGVRLANEMRAQLRPGLERMIADVENFIRTVDFESNRDRARSRVDHLLRALKAALAAA